MKNRKTVLISIFLITLLAIPFSCKKKKEVEFDRASLLTNIGNNSIVPSYTTLTNKTNELNIAANNFVSTPDNINLTALQNAWKEASSAWKKCETYTFAYAGDNMLMGEIDAWPTNPTVIETEINGTNTITEAYISTTGTTRKGLPAIEYLIFSTTGDADILNKFTVDANYIRRQEYLKALTADIKTKTGKCSNSWNTNGGNYITTFISNASDDAGSSVTLLLNAMVQNLEVIKNDKIGIPLGKKSNGTLHPELTEAGLSQMSLNHIYTNLTTLENLYLGRANGIDGTGFDDYLTFVKAEYDGQPLADVIKQQFANCYSTLNVLTPPLETSLSSENAKVEAAYLELKKLVVLMKLDMSSQLGILITFSDNDGD